MPGQRHTYLSQNNNLSFQFLKILNAHSRAKKAANHHNQSAPKELRHPLYNTTSIFFAVWRVIYDTMTVTTFMELRCSKILAIRGQFGILMLRSFMVKYPQWPPASRLDYIERGYPLARIFWVLLINYNYGNRPGIRCNSECTKSKRFFHFSCLNYCIGLATPTNMLV